MLLTPLVGVSPGQAPGEPGLSLEATRGRNGSRRRNRDLVTVSLSSPAPAWRQHCSHGSIAPGTGSGSAPSSIMQRIISTVPSGTKTMASARYSTAP